jgi:hypothetical protein
VQTQRFPPSIPSIVWIGQQLRRNYVRREAPAQWESRQYWELCQSSDNEWAHLSARTSFATNDGTWSVCANDFGLRFSIHSVKVAKVRETDQLVRDLPTEHLSRWTRVG